jgi:hypothetical protein
LPASHSYELSYSYNLSCGFPLRDSYPIVGEGLVYPAIILAIAAAPYGVSLPVTYPAAASSADTSRSDCLRPRPRPMDRNAKARVMVYARELMRRTSQSAGRPNQVWLWGVMALRPFEGKIQPYPWRMGKIGAKIVSHGRYIAYQMAEIAIDCRKFICTSGGEGQNGQVVPI